MPNKSTDLPHACAGCGEPGRRKAGLVDLLEGNMGSKRPNKIETFWHCSKCLDELPVDVSPKQWARLEIGATDEGDIQVWCVRHEMNVLILRVMEKDHADS